MSAVPFCTEGCGRRVWHFDSRLCAPCDERSARRQRRGAQRPGEPEHGTQRRYRHGCRCPKCRTANAADKRERRQRAS